MAPKKPAENAALAQTEARDEAETREAIGPQAREHLSAAQEGEALQPFDQPIVTIAPSQLAGAEKERVETAPGVFSESTVVERITGKPPMASGPVDLVRPPVAQELERSTVAAEPPTVTVLEDRRRVTMQELESPAVRAATESARANLAVCLLRPGDRVTQPVDCLDIFDPRAIIGLQVGAIVPPGNALIPANLVNRSLLG
jgi:hypothetical protein